MQVRTATFARSALLGSFPTLAPQAGRRRLGNRGRRPNPDIRCISGHLVLDTISFGFRARSWGQRHPTVLRWGTSLARSDRRWPILVSSFLRRILSSLHRPISTPCTIRCRRKRSRCRRTLRRLNSSTWPSLRTVRRPHSMRSPLPASRLRSRWLTRLGAKYAPCHRPFLEPDRLGHLGCRPWSVRLLPLCNRPHRQRLLRNLVDASVAARSRRFVQVRNV